MTGIRSIPNHGSPAAALRGWERARPHGAVVRGKAEQLARLRKGLAEHEPMRITDTHDYVPVAASMPSRLLWPGCGRTAPDRAVPMRTTNLSGEAGV